MGAQKLKVMIVAGTRPEWIRQACVIHRLRDVADLVVVHTGQNYDYELNEVFFEDLGLGKPNYFLNAAGASASETIGKVIIEVDKVIAKEKPEALLILGDTNSCMAALPARKNKVPVYHMEAGNRCFDFNVPEELNRRVVDHVSDFNLCYTEHARRHLLAEGLPHRRIYVTGSPMREVLSKYEAQIDASDILKTLSLEKQKYFIASFHREENVDNPKHLKEIVSGLDALSKEYGVKTVVSTHPRTKKRMEEFGIDAPESMEFLKPFGFHDYNHLQKNCLCAISDSGTISEESSMLGFPAVTIRNALERPEAMDTGAIILTGLDARIISLGVAQAIDDFKKGEIPDVPNDYEIMNTSQRVVRLIIGTSGLNSRWDGLDVPN